MLGFVPQENVLLPTETPKEALDFACRLKRSSKEPNSFKQKKVEDLIAKLGLTEWENLDFFFFFGVEGRHSKCLPKI